MTAMNHEELSARLWRLAARVGKEVIDESVGDAGRDVRFLIFNSQFSIGSSHEPTHKTRTLAC